MNPNARSNLEAIYRWALGIEVAGILLLSLIKLFVFWRYTSHQCVGRSLHAHWKAVEFCVSSGELLMWRSTDFAIGAIVVLFLITSLVAFVYSRFSIASPND